MAVLISEEQMRQAESEAEAAAGALKEAERAYASNRASRSAYDTHQDAVRAADFATTKVKVLREGWQAQQAERDRRAAAGRDAVKEMAPQMKEVVRTREAAVKAATAAAAALGKALAALDAHDQAVRGVGVELGRRGLRSVDGEATGVNLDGSVRVDGVLWPLTDVTGVLLTLLAGEVKATYPRHPFVKETHRPFGGVSAAQGRDAVLAAVREASGR
ncbi:hypothetical protein [Streptomyces sediminimaris]|uniref:hypothetical protein n=1 Tax=Streptomyces sediminimaris TaxID=3383721 RepID=UPI00399B762C